MAIIEDGTGTGNNTRVDKNNRAHVRSVTTSENESANKAGRAYNINTGAITLTSGSESAIMYVKNNESTDLHVTSIAVGLGPSTGGDSSEIPTITVVRNPTAGTVVSDASAVSINSNRNYGSSDTLTADAYKGAEGKTLTNGTDHLLFFQAANGRLFATIDEVIPKGSSIGIKVDPQASNTSMKCYAALICHLEDPNE